MRDLSDVERDAVQAVQALAGINRRLARGTPEPDERVALQAMADHGGLAAGRVLAYLRELRGAGDGEATAYPARLGPWREWCPPRGNVLGGSGVDVHDSRRDAPGSGRGAPGHGDPGE